MHKCKSFGSAATAATSERNVAGFPAIRTVVEAVGAKTHVVLSLADGAVPEAVDSGKVNVAARWRVAQASFDRERGAPF